MEVRADIGGLLEDIARIERAGPGITFCAIHTHGTARDITHIPLHSGLPMSLERRFRRSALWAEVRTAESALRKSDDVVFMDLLRRLAEEPSSLLHTVPHIEITFGGRSGHGDRLTCGKCRVTAVPPNSDKLAEFIVLHAGCEGR